MAFGQQQNNNNKDEFSFVIKEKVAVLSTNEKGWQKQLNVISFNGAEPVMDLRNWSPDGKMSKGITIKEDEWLELVKVVKAKY